MALLMAPVCIGEFTNARWKTAEQVPKVRDSRTSSKRCANQIPAPTAAPGNLKAAISRTLDNCFGKTGKPVESVALRWGHRVFVAEYVAG